MGYSCCIDKSFPHTYVYWKLHSLIPRITHLPTQVEYLHTLVYETLDRLARKSQEQRDHLRSSLVRSGDDVEVDLDVSVMPGEASFLDLDDIKVRGLSKRGFLCMGVDVNVCLRTYVYVFMCMMLVEWM